MNIKELKEAIKNLPDDMEVILQRDSEGNCCSPLIGADPNYIYVEENDWSGDVYSDANTADDNYMEEDEWEELKKSPRCCVLYPINYVCWW